MADKTIHELTQISAVTQLSEFPMWDSANNTTKKATLQQVKELIASGIVAGVSFIGTRAEYETAKLIPSGQEGYIPSGSLVIITDENRTYVTSGTGSEQTLSLVARVMSAGDGINISNDDKINADTVTFTGTRARWRTLSSAEKAKYNIVNFTDDLECAYQDIYSTTEVKTNKVWIDEKPIYRITFYSASNWSNNTEIGELNNKSTITNIRDITCDGSGSTYQNYGTDGTNTSYAIVRSNGKVYVNRAGTFVNSYPSTVIIEYTKSN